MTSNTQEELIIRPQNNFDLSVPSGTSVTAYAFLRLFHLTQNTVFYDKYLNILKSHANDAAENPFAYSNLLNIIYIYIKKPLEITVVNTTDNDICNFINTKFLPESISVMIKNNNILNTNKNPFFNGKIFQNFTNVYICKNFTCSLPITTISELKKHLI